MLRDPAQHALNGSREAGLGAREWNPVVVREGRVRWRGARAYWLALGYACFLALVLWWSYNSSLSFLSTQDQTPMDALGTAAQLGHDLFKVLCFCQLGAWLLLAPILTAASISGERQKGLLEGLLLSRLRPEQIVYGKWVSALSLIVLLQLAGLPVMAVCFLLGGVSPGEVIGALAILLSAAGCGAACGIASSSCSRNNSDAASGAIVSVVGWMLGTGMAYIALRGSGYIPLVNEAVLLIVGANPIVSMIMLFSPLPSSGGNQFEFGLWRVLMASGCGWMFSVAGMGLLSALLLKHAGQVLRRSPERFDEPPVVSRAAASTYRPTTSSMADMAQGEAHQLEVGHLRRPQLGHIRPEGSWQMPILERIVFGSAMMQRELTLLWRWPLLSENEKSGAGVLVLFLFLFVCAGLNGIFESQSSAQGVWSVLLMLYGVAGALLCAARPASSIAREREGGLWQGLSLTLLSPSQVTSAKVLAPIVAALGYGGLACLFLVLAAWNGHIGLGAALSSVLSVLLAWAQVASWSTLVGTRVRVPGTALGWALGVPAVAWAGVLLLISLFNVQVYGAIGFGELSEFGGSAIGLEFLRLLNPLVALDMGVMSSQALLQVLGLQSILTAILLGLAQRAVQRSR